MIAARNPVPAEPKVSHIGQKGARRLLDGVEHDGMAEVRHG